MIKSMTGFGRGKFENEGRIYTVEIKSVNHKYSDVSIKMPKYFNVLEETIRKRVSDVISRGKIDIFIGFENFSEQGVNIRFNNALAKNYIEGLKKLAEETGVEYKIDLIDIAKFPDIVKLEDEDIEELISKELLVALDEALVNFVDMRSTEGEKLAQDIKARIAQVETKVNEIKNYSSTLVQEYIERLETRINELMKDKIVDEQRLAQEIVIFSDKSSIEEELTRLDSHISQIKALIDGDESPIGKKMDFIVQEINRETNTIGSKANSIDITNRVIDIKTIVEDIREQIQNIE